jgi:type IV secretion system protein VirB3
MNLALEIAEVFTGATRPSVVPYVWIPLKFFILLTMLAMAIIMITKNPLYEIVMPLAWWGVRQWVKYDYNADRVALLWARTKGRSWDAWFWGGASPATMPISPRKLVKRVRGVLVAW